MFVRVVDPPAPIVTWDEAKKQLHLDTEEEKLFVESLVAAATAHLDGPAGTLGRCIGPQTLEMIVSSFSSIWTPQGIALPCPPFIEMVSVKHLDATGAEQTVASSVYYGAGGFLVLRSGMSWPAHGSYSDAIRIRWRAGYDENKTGPVPMPIKQAVLVMVSDLYLNREGSASSADLSTGAARSLLSPYRLRRV